MRQSKTRLATCALASVLTLVLSAAPRAHADDGAPREWNQVRGGAARSGLVTMEPVRRDPTVAWREELPGRVVSEPVTWGGTIFVAYEKGGKLTLEARHARTGKLVTTRGIGKGTWCDLATWQGMVIVCGDRKLQALRLRGDKFANGWSKSGKWGGVPCVYRGLVLARDGGNVRLFDAASGREFGKQSWLPDGQKGTAEGGYPMLVVRPRKQESEADVYGVYRGGAKGKLFSHRHALKGVGTRKAALGAGVAREEGNSPDVRGPAEVLRSVSLACIDTGSKAALVLSSTDGGAKAMGIGGTKRRGTMIQLPGALWKDAMFGMAVKPSPGLYRMPVEGREQPLMKGETLPRGARPGPAYSADGVICFGNWAFGVADRRALWNLADLPAVRFVIPVSDGMALVVGPAGELVCIAEPDRVVTADAAAGTGAPGSEAAPPPPGAGDGLFLADGRKIAGSFKQAGENVRVTPREGEPFDVPLQDVALGEASGDITLRGEEPAVLRAWQEILDGLFTRALLECFETYHKQRMVSDCRRIIADARSYGIGTTLAEKLQKRIAGVSEHPNAEFKRKRYGPEEKERRQAIVQEALAASAWCAKRDYGGAATVLLDYALREDVPETDVHARAKKLMPESFPWKADRSAVKQWLVWAREIVPAGGRFLEESDSDWRRARGKPWDEDTIAIRSNDVLLFSRNSDPAIVGLCLRTAEGTVRALHGMIGDLATGDKRPLDVRLHKNREDYLAEETRVGKAMEWSAGYFSPTLMASRFYVPDPERTVETQGRGLAKTLAHELTHHWLWQRWLSPSERGQSVGTPGFWVVEGLARFVEDQAVEMGRRRGRLDDDTVAALDIASQVAVLGKLQPVGELLRMTQTNFGNIKEVQIAVVTLRNSIGTRVVDRRSLFYNQSGSLVFYLMNRAGEEARDAFLRYVRQHYKGVSGGDPSKGFGFEDAGDLNAKFEEFLKSLRE